MMAIDSLQKENINIEVWVYDSRKKGQSTVSLTSEMLPLKFSMIIASFTNASEQKVLSDFSFNNTIPLISATYPNDANINGNPMFLMVNPTWKTHIAAIAGFIKENYPDSKPLVITKSGVLEEKILQELTAAKAKKLLPAFTPFSASDKVDFEYLKPYLDSTKKNIIICGSLNEEFGSNLIKTLNNAPGFSTVLIGMPTWNGMKATSGADCKNISLMFTTPYNYKTTSPRIAALASNYKAKYNARPGDMVFKGYETMYHFTKLLLQQKGIFIIKASEPSFKVTNDFDFQPVRQNNSSVLPDYQENKKIYFIKVINGVVQSGN